MKTKLRNTYTYSSLFNRATILLLFLSQACFSQQTKKDSLIFKGIILDADQVHPNWKMSVAYSKTDGFDAIGSLRYFSPEIDNHGNFSFKLPNLAKPYKFVIAVFEKSDDGVVKLLENHFYTEPGDHIDMRIILELHGRHQLNSNSMTFSGDGAAKYKLAWELQNGFYHQYLNDLSLMDMATPKVFKDSLEVDSEMLKLAILIRGYAQRKSTMINLTTLTPLMRKIISYAFGGYMMGLNYEWTLRSKWLYEANPKFRKQIANHYLKMFSYFTKPTDDIATIFSPNYIEELLRREIFRAQIKNNDKAPDIQNFFRIIDSGYSGKVKDRLLAHTLTDKNILIMFQPIKPDLMDSLINNLALSSTTPYIQKTLSAKIVEQNRLNMKLFNGKFLTLEGREFELKSLRGKIILLDVWFNGCFGCADFHARFKEVYPTFKSNKDFVVISINVDKDREKWLKGIESNKYTSKEHIQVTTGNWFDHPFMKYYNINGASYVMLVDADGTILPRTSTFEELWAQIKETLNKHSANKTL